MTTIFLPDEIEPELYKSYYLDLQQFSKNQILQHYENYGRFEGRRSNRIGNREEFAELVPKDLKSLEIGPFANPLLNGPNVDFADKFSHDELIDKAKSYGLDWSKVPTITWVLSKYALREIPFDYEVVLSSHNIEHQTDFISHLLDVEKLLRKRAGYYFLLIPDKRYCFDRNNHETTLSEVIDAYINRNKVHSLEKLINYYLRTHNDPVIHWRENGIRENYLYDAENITKIQLAIAEFDAARGAYIDTHGLYFTPENFQKIIKALNDLKYINFRLERLYHTRTNSNEFWAVLKLK